MKIKLLFAAFFFIIQYGFSQSETLIRGKVLQEQFPIRNVEVANFSSKKTVITNESGEFSILGKVGDELIFISRNHDIKKIIVNRHIIDENNFMISLILKAEQLEEVVITKMPSIKLSKDETWEQGKLDEMALEKAAITPKVMGVYTGKIENGMDIMRIGGMILGLFIKEKEEKIKHEVPQVEFTVLAKTSCNQKFYLENLKLKLDEIDLFLQFCDADPKSKTLIKNNNVLSMMDFLTTKNLEFKKL